MSESFIDTCMAHSFFNLFKTQAEKNPVENGDLWARAARTKDIILLPIPEYKMNRNVLKRPEFSRLLALDACGLLNDRGIMEPSDLIAILGNLCQYKIRLNTWTIRQAGLSFSVCALALSLLNGDMSLFLGLEHTPRVSGQAWYFGVTLSVATLMDAFNNVHQINPGFSDTTASSLYHCFFSIAHLSDSPSSIDSLCTSDCRHALDLRPQSAYLRRIRAVPRALERRREKLCLDARGLLRHPNPPARSWLRGHPIGTGPLGLDIQWQDPRSCRP